MVVDTEPTAAAVDVEPGHDLGPVWPVSRWREGGSLPKLVTVGGKQQRPIIIFIKVGSSI